MRPFNRWWGRALLYGVITAAVAWSAYHLAYRHYAGPYPDDSASGLGFFYGVVWATGMSAIVMFVVAAVEGVLLVRRPPE